MPKPKCKNSNNSSQGNMSPLEPSHPPTASPEYPNTVEAQENNLKTNFIMINYYKEIKGRMTKKLGKINKSLNE